MHELALTLAYLDQGHQARELVAEVQKTFSHPNFCVRIDQDFLHRRFANPVHETNPVNELILGTTIRGTSLLTGSVSPKLLHSPERATLQLNLLADFSSNNRGYNRSVVVRTTGNADVFASESVALLDSGLMPLGDAYSDADLRTQIHGIYHKLKIVRKIAAKQAAKQKPLADAIGESRLENRLRRQFHEQLGERLQEANQRLEMAGREELARLGISKPQRTSWSTTDTLGLNWLVRKGVQLAADAPCPWGSNADGFTVQVHQSLLGNLLDPVLGGRVIRSQDMEGYTAQFGELVRGVPRKEEDGPWSITLSGFQPVELELDDSRVRFRIRTERLDREGQALDQSAVIEANYQVLVEGKTVRLQRDGDINVAFSGRLRTGVQSVTLRTFLKNKFEQLFREQLPDKPVNWTERLPSQFQDLQLSAVDIDDGWMQVRMK
jgi:hypothetical protein